MPLPHTRAVFLAALVTLTPPVWGAALDDGLSAYRRGDHARALALLRPLAQQGDPSAQNTLGLMYANGQGVKRDDPTAAAWLRRAAAGGHAAAQRNLDVLVANGRAKAAPHADVEPDCQ
jgi:TPR repeat protein